MGSRGLGWIFGGLFFVVLSLPVNSLHASEEVRVQLRWTHQFQFAGYYMALERGYYRDAGLDVEIIEGGPEAP